MKTKNIFYAKLIVLLTLLLALQLDERASAQVSISPKDPLGILNKSGERLLSDAEVGLKSPTQQLVFTEADFRGSNKPSKKNILEQVYSENEVKAPALPPKNTLNSNFEFLENIGIAIVLIALAMVAGWILLKILRPIFRNANWRKIVTILGAVTFVVCGLFPPWLKVSYSGHISAQGYHFILSPDSSTRLDLSRLSVEWLCIAITTGIFWYLIPQKKP